MISTKKTKCLFLADNKHPRKQHGRFAVHFTRGIIARRWMLLVLSLALAIGAGLGLMTILSIGSALILDFLLLPADAAQPRRCA